MIKKIKGVFFEKMELYNFPFDVQVNIQSIYTQSSKVSEFFFMFLGPIFDIDVASVF